LGSLFSLVIIIELIVTQKHWLDNIDDGPEFTAKFQKKLDILDILDILDLLDKLEKPKVL